jgi:prepilin-type N-terminal cleavage/methylation domain-containing protein
MASQENKRDGFTIAELLVALAITAILLTAVAVAFNASAINYNENAEMFNALNRGRQAMLRITNQLRTANAVATTEAATQCSFFDATNTNVRVLYDNTDKIIYLYPDLTNHSTTRYMLCNNVTAMTFTRTVGVDSGGHTCVKNVQMSMTVTVGDNSQQITGAVVLRKTL